MPNQRARPTATLPRPSLRPKRFNSLIASAEILLAPNRALRATIPKVDAWQDEAWGFYDDAGGLLRAGIGWLANAMSRVNIGAASPPSSPADEPKLVTVPDPDDEGAEPLTRVQARSMELMEVLAGGSVGQGQMLNSFATQLSVAGLGWFVAEPDLADPESDEYDSWEVVSVDELRQTGRPRTMEDGTIDPTSVKYQRATGDSTWRDLHPNALVIKCWRKHPRKSWMPDAPTRAVLTTLREIDLLTKHVHASAQSRLAGAGLLILPTEAEFPPGQGQPQPPPEDPEAPEDPQATAEPPPDPFIPTLIQVMSVAIGDRSSPAAITPLVIRIPGEFVDKVKWITFSTGFDERVLALREAAVRSLALGLDMPPEVLLGMADVNHWSAWQITEQGITLHIIPMAETISEALTIGYLNVALEAEGFSEDDIATVMVWYDTTDLTSRPDLSKQAEDAYQNVAIGVDAYLTYLGLSPDDKPGEEEERKRWLLRAALGAPTNAPFMLAKVGFLDESDLPSPGGDAAAPPPDDEGGADDAPADGPPPPPDDAPDETEGSGPPPAAALIAACDGIVYRALERSGARLRSSIGRKNGGAGAITCDDPTRLHVNYDPTVFDDLDRLLEGAWVRVPEVAARHAVNADALAATLTAYTRGLLAAQHPHTYERLQMALAG